MKRVTRVCGSLRNNQPVKRVPRVWAQVFTQKTSAFLRSRNRQEEQLCCSCWLFQRECSQGCDTNFTVNARGKASMKQLWPEMSAFLRRLSSSAGHRECNQAPCSDGTLLQTQEINVATLRDFLILYYFMDKSMLSALATWISRNLGIRSDCVATPGKTTGLLGKDNFATLSVFSNINKLPNPRVYPKESLCSRAGIPKINNNLS